VSNIKTIAKNSGWFGFENAINAVVTLITSIAIARTLGPSKMGYFIYVSWIASVVSSLGGLGIPSTTLKYMAEFLGMGDRGTARYIYFRTMLMQVGMATIATAGILFWVLRDSNAEYRVAAVLVVLSIWPQMVNQISSFANMAAEEFSANMQASILSILTYLLLILSTVVFHWGIIGVGVATFSMRAVDFLVRLFPTMKRIRAWETTHVHPEGLRTRMIAFAWQSVASMIVALIVWDRSEFLLLKKLCADIRQIAYYSVAFSMAERLLISSSIFTGATGVTILAQYGRDKTKLAALTASTFRYLALTSIPLHVLASALAAPALLFLYGGAYKDAAMVVTLAPLLCMPKAFIAPAQSILTSYERQSFIIAFTIIAGIVDIGIAWWLIPKHGAVGACIGSGAAQVFAVGAMWAIGIYLYKVKLPWLLVAKISFISVTAALTAHFIAAQFTPLLAIMLGGSASLIVLFGLMYLMRVLEIEDSARFNVLIKMLPKPCAKPLNTFLSMIIHAENTSRAK